MTAMNDVRPGEVFEIDPAGSSRPFHVPIWIFLVVAAIVTELTAHPAIGVAVFCLKFGLNDWRTAIWLVRVDPQSRRSHSIWWFLVGSGFLKIFLMSSIAFPILAGWWAAIFRVRVRDEVLVAMMIGLGGMVFSFVVNHIGLYLAARRRVRVWLNRQLHQCRANNQWPVRLTGANRVREMLNGSALPAILSLVLGAAFLIVFAMQGNIQGGTISGIVTLVSSLILLGHGLSVKRIVARSPDECWDDLPVLELDDAER
jgi:uncharacterized membrane protein (DUF485 family)